MNNGSMIGSNSDSSSIIFTLMAIATKLGATPEKIVDALDNKEGSSLDKRRVIGFLKLIADLTSSGGSGGEFTAEDRAKLNTIPTKVSQLSNDSAFITKAVSDLGNYYKKSETHTKTEVAQLITSHNTATNTHSDIRTLISSLTTKLNTLANSDDTTLDQMSEIVAYIKSNKSLIDSITTAKVSVTDIIDNLTTSVATKPLSAKQGVAIKALIDAIKVPTALSALTEDATHRLVTDTEKTAWNAKSTFSGSYNDLSNKPTNLVTKTGISIALHTDGLLYLFIDGAPVGTGITITAPTA